MQETQGNARARAQHHSGRLSIVNQFRTVVNFPVTQGRMRTHIPRKNVYKISKVNERKKKA